MRGIGEEGEVKWEEAGRKVKKGGVYRGRGGREDRREGKDRGERRENR